MRAVIVSFYTAGTAYADEAQELAASARQFGLLTDIRPVPNLGDWTLNCSLKPAFIRDRMQDYPGRPIVWLDADARVRQPPDLFDALDCDFAGHWRHGAELLSGTLYFGPTLAARALVTLWAEEQLKTPGVWDQKVLHRVIDGGAVNWLKIRELPKEYVAVFDDAKMGTPETWVVSHHQSSRRLKKHVQRQAM